MVNLNNSGTLKKYQYSMYQYMRQCDFCGIVKKRLSRKMQIFCRKVKIANYAVSNEDINMRMVGNCSVTHFNQRSHGVF